ncbi:hypothetical protein Q3G72_006045 [Acer saccharum]|nr:hypothetical protein Q3G72_006045 [Acer saccharum]
MGAYEPTAPLVRNHSLGLGSVVQTRPSFPFSLPAPIHISPTRQAHLPEVEWNTRALQHACLRPFTREVIPDKQIREENPARRSSFDSLVNAMRSVSLSAFKLMVAYFLRSDSTEKRKAE